MNWLYTIFLGLIQGVTEFLPVSSSGHLAIFQYFFGLTSPEESNLFFDVILHLGTLIAVFIYFRKDIAALWRGFIGFFNRSKSPANPGDPAAQKKSQRMILMLIIATLPLVVIIFLKDSIDALYKNINFVGAALVITGIVLYFSNKVKPGKKAESTVTVKDSLLIGVAQMFATLPGISRSGMTISAGLWRGFDRSFAVRFSFLLSIPAILAANLLSFVDALQTGIDWSLAPHYLVGMLIAGISGYFCLGLINRLVNNSKFGKFSYYCMAVGAFVLLFALIF